MLRLLGGRLVVWFPLCCCCCVVCLLFCLLLCCAAALVGCVLVGCYSFCGRSFAVVLCCSCDCCQCCGHCGRHLSCHLGHDSTGRDNATTSVHALVSLRSKVSCFCLTCSLVYLCTRILTTVAINPAIVSHCFETLEPHFVFGSDDFGRRPWELRELQVSEAKIDQKVPDHRCP